MAAVPPDGGEHCLNSRFPIVLWWGPDLRLLYNDAWRPVLGRTKHPQARGSPGQDIWPEIWDIIGPMLNGVLAEGKAHDPECHRITCNPAGYEILRQPLGSNVSLSASPEEMPRYRVFRRGRELSAEELPMQKALRIGVEVRDTEMDLVYEGGTGATSMSTPLRCLTSTGR